MQFAILVIIANKQSTYQILVIHELLLVQLVQVLLLELEEKVVDMLVDGASVVFDLWESDFHNDEEAVRTERPTVHLHAVSQLLLGTQDREGWDLHMRLLD